MRCLYLCLLLLFTPLLVAAQPSLSAYEFNQLNAAHQLMQDAQWQQAKVRLLDAESTFRDGYAKALVQHNLAQVGLQTEDYPFAINKLKAAFALRALPEKQQTEIYRTLGRLHCMQAQWRECVTELNAWLQHASDQQITGHDHIYLAQAYSHLERWFDVVQQVNHAMQFTSDIPRNWYQLKVVAYVQLKQWAQAVRTQQQLLDRYADLAQDWRTLVSLQMQAGEEKKALATQRLALERKVIASASDYRLLSQLALRQGMPQLAATTLSDAIRQGRIKSSEQNLTLLSQAWLRAGELSRAVEVMAKLYKQVPGTDNALRLARMQMQATQWQQAEQTLTAALQQNTTNPELQLLLGISLSNQKHYKEARRYLSKVSRDKAQGKTATSWLQYLELLESRSE
jgi:predicted Zn-dependent protease